MSSLAPTALRTAGLPAEAAPSSGADLGARSLTAAVYQRLREDIIANRLVQNEKLHLARLTERFRVSLSVVREALSRLVADGLVVAEAQRGFRVSPVSKKDLIDVTATRARIEGMALSMAIERGDEAWLDALRTVHAAMNRVDRVAHTPLWTARHADFHRVLLAPCDSAWLMRFRDLLFEQSERYRYLFDGLAANHQLPIARDVDAEHLALVDAVCARDAARATEVLRHHFSATMQVVLAATAIE